MYSACSITTVFLQHAKKLIKIKKVKTQCLLWYGNSTFVNNRDCEL